MTTKPTDLTYSDLILPNQGFLRRDFLGSDQHLYSSMLNLIVRATAQSSPVEQFDLLQSERHSVEEMASHPILLNFLQFVIRISGAQRILEIGAFIGVSAMYMARALPPHGKVISIEKFSEFAEISRQNFQRNNLSDVITLIEADAFEVLPTMDIEMPFDLIFLDGNKERYDEYFPYLERLLAPKGLIMVDNMFCCGDVLNEVPRTEKAQGVKRFIDVISQRDDLDRVLLPIYDGVFLVKRQSEP